MEKKKGFTLIELMVVILIVGILAAVAIPILRGRVESAKWTEGKAMIGSIGTAIRAYSAESATGATYTNPTLAQLGFQTSDFTGTYFASTNFSWVSTNPATGLTFTITATPGTGMTGGNVTLTQVGVWTGP